VPAAEQVNECLRETRVDGFERFLELPAGRRIDLFDRLRRVSNRVEQILALGRQNWNRSSAS